MPTSYSVENSVQLLTFLLARYPQLTKAKLRQWLKHRSAHVNGEPVTRSTHWLQPGDVVTIRSRDEVRSTRCLPRGMHVWFEDEALLVVEKPANLLSIASAAQRDKTAYAALTDYVRCGNPWSPARVWIVHRLDRETSGLMVFARTPAAKHSLQATWEQADKRYQAVVAGRPPAPQGTLRSHVDESQASRVYSAAPGEHTRRAVTHYRVLRQRASRTLIELTLETGRRHQIRVQLADAGCPVLGDTKYGSAARRLPRLALHACFLQFRHPTSGQLLTFESPLPPQLARLV